MSDKVFLPNEMYEHLEANGRAAILQFDDADLQKFLTIPVLAPHVREFAEKERANRQAKALTSAAEFSAQANAHTSGNTGAIAKDVTTPLWRSKPFILLIIGSVITLVIAIATSKREPEPLPNPQAPPQTAPRHPSPDAGTKQPNA